MRVLNSRGDWRPAAKIETLKRYAVIGDSTAFGAGVAPNETLAAYAERHMNEALSGWPVEAVNFGVSGYNLWNSWLGFKHSPQAYDGVVIVLCNNDADLFQRSFRVEASEPFHKKWDETHAFGQEVKRCFDDVAAFSQAAGLHVAVCFYSPFDNPNQRRISEIIAALCAARGLVFVDTFSLYKERHLPFTDVIVSKADLHPSALAHEAVGRHLVAAASRLGWFGDYDVKSVEAAPGRIMAAAQAMIEQDNYPLDAALRWALRTLETKALVARRARATGVAHDFEGAAGRALTVLKEASMRWHATQRMKAFMLELGMGGHRVAGGLWRAAEVRMRLEELLFVLAGDNAARLMERIRPTGGPASPMAAMGTRDFLRRCEAALEEFHGALAGLQALTTPGEIWPRETTETMQPELAAFAELARRGAHECKELEALFTRVEPWLSETAVAGVTNVADLLRNELQEWQVALSFLLSLKKEIDCIGESSYAPFTSIELNLSATVEGARPCQVAVQADYAVPTRLGFKDAGYFVPDGTTQVVRLTVPLFYAGRVTFSHWAPGASDERLEVTLLKVELYNQPNLRRSIDPKTFFRNATGDFVSPLVFLM